MKQVRHKRQMLGGDMRQAGIIAAAGIVALESMVDRLQEDHANAQRLAMGLSGIPGIEIDLSTVQTNTVVFRVVDQRFDCRTFIELTHRHGLRLSEFKRGRLRAVLHYGISEDDVEQAIKIITRVLEEAAHSDSLSRPMVAHGHSS